MVDRYHRHKVLAGIGDEGQKVLSASSVLMVGCGGLASPALLYLAGAGIGRIGLLDDDRVNLDNLQRQVLFRSDQKGRLKVEAARESLLALNPDIQIDAHAFSLSSENAESFFLEYDLILDGTDSYEAKALINEWSLKTQKPMIFAGVTELDAQVSVFGGAPDKPCYRCLFPAPPLARIENCNDAGVLGPLVGVAGSLQALEAIKTLLDRAGKRDPSWSTLSGRLLIADGRDLSIQTRTLERNPACPGCSGKAASHEASLRMISESEYRAKKKKFLLIDVREESEFQENGLEGAVNVPLSKIRQGTRSLPGDGRTPLLFCKTGTRARTAARLLSQFLPTPVAVFGLGVDDLRRMQ